MKNAVLTFAAILFFTSASFAGNNNGNNGNGGSNDTEKAEHQIGITIPTVAIVDIEGSGNQTTIELNPSVSDLEAGEAINFSGTTNSDLKLNYSSIINDNTNQITAEIDVDTETNYGFSIKLSVGSNTGGSGELGDAAEDVELSTSPAAVVTGIGSCYSGDGNSKGRTLTYSLVAKDYSKIIGQEYDDITVTYTILEEN